jgi:hypothetical protein
VVLPIVYRIENLKRDQGPTKGCRAIIIIVIMIIMMMIIIIIIIITLRLLYLLFSGSVSEKTGVVGLIFFPVYINWKIKV